MIWTVDFWKGLGERAIKTFIQTFTASLAVGIAGAETAWDVSWQTVLWVALGVAILSTVGSILTSFGSIEFVAGKTSEIVAVPAVPEVTTGETSTNSDDDWDASEAAAFDAEPERAITESETK